MYGGVKGSVLRRLVGMLANVADRAGGEKLTFCED